MDVNYNMRNRRSQQSLFTVRRSNNTNNVSNNNYNNNTQRNSNRSGYFFSKQQQRGGRNRNSNNNVIHNKNINVTRAVILLSTSILFICSIFGYYFLVVSTASASNSNSLYSANDDINIGLDPNNVALRGGGITRRLHKHDVQRKQHGSIHKYQQHKNDNNIKDTIKTTTNNNEYEIEKDNNKIENEEEEAIIINEKDYLHATSIIIDDADNDLWGNSAASSYAELPFPIDLHPNQLSNDNSKDDILVPVNPFVMSVWVYLKKQSKSNNKLNNTNNRVILTSKRESCPTTPETAGIKLSILDSSPSESEGDNNKDKRYLVLEYSNRLVNNGECIYIDTNDQHPPIILQSWVHIGVAISYTQQHYNSESKEQKSSMTLTIKLYVDGSLVKNYQQEHTFILTNTQLKLSKLSTTRIGQNFNHDNFLEGHIAELALWMGTMSSIENKSTDLMMRSIFRAGVSDNSDSMEFVTESMGVGKSPSYLFPMKQTKNDNNKVKSELKEMIQNKHGIVYRGIQMDNYKPLGGFRYQEYKDGTNIFESIPSIQRKSDKLARVRRIHIREAMKRTWDAYLKYANGKDEFLPLKKEGLNKNGGIATMLINSLDTLWLMKLHQEFNDAKEWVRNNLFNHAVGVVSVYETTLRNLGGLLSAYDLTSDKIFLSKADELGSRLINTFDSPSGLPYAQTTLNTGRSFNVASLQGNVLLAEIGSIQLEFRYLAKAVNKQIYAKKANKVFDVLASMSAATPIDGLLPSYIRNEVDPPTFGNNKISLGENNNISFYATLLKVYMQAGKYEHKYKRMYDRAVNSITETLLHKSSPNGLTYVAEWVGGKIEHKMDASVCSFAGTLALGVHISRNQTGVNNSNAQRDLQNAKALAYTCYQMYAQMSSGLSGESVTFDNSNLIQDFEVSYNAAFHLLRPQLAESLFILYQVTHDPTYREWGWEIFQSIETYCRTDIAYATLKDVNNAERGLENRLEPYFTSATLKYLYLLQDPDTDIDIFDKYVLNAEGHVLKVLSNVKEMKWGV